MAEPARIPTESGELAELFELAWALFLAHRRLLVLAAALEAGLLLLASLAAAAVGPPVAVAGLVSALAAFFSIGQLRILLSVIRGRPEPLRTLFSGGDRLGTMLAVAVPGAFAIVAGTSACVVPGVIVAVHLAFAPWLVADTHLGALDAVRTARKLVRGRLREATVAAAATFAVLGAGLLACGMGAVVSYPVAMLAWGLVLERLRGADPVASVRA